MTAQHPSRTWRGCAMCKAHKIKGRSQRKMPWSAQRALGKKRRLTRIEEY